MIARKEKRPVESHRKVIPQFAKTRQQLFIFRLFLRRQSIRFSGRQCNASRG